MNRIYLSPPDVRGLERDAVLSAIDSNWVAPIGPDLDAFESEIAQWADRPFAVGLSSGTAALHLALSLLGVGHGDEVLVPTLTFVPTASAATYLGARPYFVDVEAESWCLAPDLVAEDLKRRARNGRLPKAAMVVDLYGQCADYAALLPLFAEYDVPIVEDAAEALGASRDGARAGSHGAFAAFSFNGNKIITTSSGGMLLSNDADSAAHARKLATQAREPVAHYEHIELGYNYRLSNILAAFGRAQLANLPARIERRRAINAAYGSALEHVNGVALAPIPEGSQPNFWLTCITFDLSASSAQPEDLRRFLEAHDVESRPIWKPLHLQPLFADHESVLDGTGASIFERGLCLPSGSSMSDDDLATVINLLEEYFARFA